MLNDRRNVPRLQIGISSVFFFCDLLLEIFQLDLPKQFELFSPPSRGVAMISSHFYLAATEAVEAPDFSAFHSFRFKFEIGGIKQHHEGFTCDQILKSVLGEME